MNSYEALPDRSTDGKYKLRQVDRVSYSDNSFRRNPEKKRKASLPHGSEKNQKNNLEHDSGNSHKDDLENQKKKNLQRDPNENTILIRHDYLSVSGSTCFKHRKNNWTVFNGELFLHEIFIQVEIQWALNTKF